MEYGKQGGAPSFNVTVSVVLTNELKLLVSSEMITSVADSYLE